MLKDPKVVGRVLCIMARLNAVFQNDAVTQEGEMREMHACLRRSLIQQELCSHISWTWFRSLEADFSNRVCY